MTPAPNHRHNPIKRTVLFFGTTGLAIAAIVTSSISPAVASTPKAPSPVVVQPAPQLNQLPKSEVSTWDKFVATKAHREKVVAVFQQAFGSFAEVGTGPLPSVVIGGRLTPNFTYGAQWSHFWIVMSFADFARGDLYIGTIACETALTLALAESGPAAPAIAGVVCGAMAGFLGKLGNGHPILENHGIYANVWFFPPHVTGGVW